MEVSVDNEYIDGLNTFKYALWKRIQFWQKGLDSCKILVEKLMSEAVGQIAEWLEWVKLFLEFLDEICDYVKNYNDSSEMIQMVGDVFTVMLLL